MTASKILRALAAYLQPIVSGAGGQFDKSGSPQNTLNRLRNAPTAWQAVLQYQGERILPGSVRSGAMEMTFLVVVQQASGLPAVAGLDIADMRAADPAILERAEQLADWMRACRLEHPRIDNQVPLNPQRVYWLVDPGDEKHPPAVRGLVTEFSVSYGRAAVKQVSVPVEG